MEIIEENRTQDKINVIEDNRHTTRKIIFRLKAHFQA